MRLSYQSSANTYEAARFDAVDGAIVTATGFAGGKVSGSATVVAKESVEINAFDDATIFATDRTRVYAHGSSQWVATGKAVVYGEGESRGRAIGATRVRLSENATATVDPGTQVICKLEVQPHQIIRATPRENSSRRSGSGLAGISAPEVGDAKSIRIWLQLERRQLCPALPSKVHGDEMTVDTLAR